ncbi:hypothetical protein ACFVEN_15990 [Streptomyces sp. NPDC057681]|uniref:hypothetical protein n=1 Tax=Streptomyces sp. NPDC057681 TaxID=3346209 RepID=UPI00367D610F
MGSPGADEDRGVPLVVAVAIAGSACTGCRSPGRRARAFWCGWRGAWTGLPLFAVRARLVLLPRRSPVRWLYGLVGLPGRHWRVEPGAGESRVTSGRPA